MLTSVKPMNCRRCGEILNANANFCWSCGAPQHDANSPETVAVPVVTAAEVLHPGTNRGPNGEHGDELVIAAGLDAGSRIELKGEIDDRRSPREQRPVVG